MGSEGGGSSAATGHGEPAAPAPARARSKTGLRGVGRMRSGRYWAKAANWWLGTFDTAGEAAAAYDAAAVTLYGDKASLNNFNEGDAAALPLPPKIETRTAGKKRNGGRSRVAEPQWKKLPSSGFFGVRRSKSGKYAAQVWDSSTQSYCGLGSFDDAEEAAAAYDEAAVALYGARAKTNFAQPREADDGDAGASEVDMDEPPRAARPKAKTAGSKSKTSTQFIGVRRTKGGKYTARISAHGVPDYPLGSFDTAEEAARAYDAAAVDLRGKSAKTNFKQLDPAVPSVNGGVPVPCSAPPSPIPAFDTDDEPTLSGKIYGDLNDFREPPALDSSNVVPTLQLDDGIAIDMSPGVLQEVDDFLNLDYFTEQVE